MIEHMFVGTTVFWVVLALLYTLTSVYLKAFSKLNYPAYVWLTYLAVGTVMFLMANRTHLFPHDSVWFTSIEMFALLTLAVVGVVMFHLSTEYAKYRDGIN